MDQHYVCTGSCNMVSDHEKNCDSEDCTHKGQPLVACSCTDGNHDEAHKRAGTGLEV